MHAGVEEAAAQTDRAAAGLLAKGRATPPDSAPPGKKNGNSEAKTRLSCGLRRVGLGAGYTSLGPTTSFLSNNGVSAMPGHWRYAYLSVRRQESLPRSPAQPCRDAADVSRQ